VSANYEDKEWFANGRLVQIQRGQLVTSNRKLQEAWGCSTNTVARILQQFAEMGMIEVEKPYKRYTLLTVVKYSIFQGGRHTDGYTDGYTDEHTDGYGDGYGDGTQTINKEEYKNEKEDPPSGEWVMDEEEEVYENDETGGSADIGDDRGQLDVPQSPPRSRVEQLRNLLYGLGTIPG
jgi:DNA-binding transcriptional MocR family regulator